MKLETTTRSEDGTIALGAALARALEPGDAIALEGDLGAGKTRMVRGLAKGLLISEEGVSSPTYVIIHQYPAGSSSARIRELIHVDAYRLSGPDELDSIGWDRVTGALEARTAVLVVEWPSRIGIGAPVSSAESPLPPSAPLAWVTLALGDAPEQRRITLDLPDTFQRRPGFSELTDQLFPRGAALPAGWARCPMTGRAVHPASPTFPFIDERARMADLGKWFGGHYTVSREISERDMDDPDLAGPAGRAP